jgi:hypothetical protein
MRAKVEKGEITQKYMNICLAKIDQAFMQKQHNERAKILEEFNNRSTGITEKGMKISQTTSASPSPASDPAHGSENSQFEISRQTADDKAIQSNTASTMKQPGTLALMDGLTDTKRKGKQAYVEDEAESDDAQAKAESALLALAANAFTVLYDCPLPRSIRLNLLERFMDSIPLHEPKPHDISKLRKLTKAEGEDSELVTELFEGYVARAEGLMQARLQRGSKTLSPEAAKLINEQDAKFKEETNKRAEKEVAKILAERTASDKKSVNKGKQGQAQKIGTGLEHDVNPKRIPVASHEKISNLAKVDKREPSLAKTSAKTKVESKHREVAVPILDDELVTSEMGARSLLRSRRANQSAKVYRAGQSAVSEKGPKPVEKGSQADRKEDVQKDHIRYKIKLQETDGKMVWPPMAANFRDPGFDKFLAYHGDASLVP